MLRLHLNSCRAGQHPDVLGWIWYPAVAGSGFPCGAQHPDVLDSFSSCARLFNPMRDSAPAHAQLRIRAPHHPDVQSSASSCARAISSCARLLIPVQDPCPTQHPAVLHPAVQDCPGAFWLYEATGLELFWMFLSDIPTKNGLLGEAETIHSWCLTGIHSRERAGKVWGEWECLIPEISSG